MDPYLEQIDIPPPVIVVDRRHIPDRRAVWRGGRRDTDWTINRPPGALSRAGREEPKMVWSVRRWLLSRVRGSVRSVEVNG